MDVVGNAPSLRRRVSCKKKRTSKRKNAASQDTAAYIAEICAELAIIARNQNFQFICHLLNMAQAEAEHVAGRNVE